LDVVRTLDDDLLETPFLRLLVNVMEDCGWLVFHDEDSRWNKSGLPDVLAVRPPRVLMAELKRNHGGRWRQGQKVWREQLLRCPGLEYYQWQPEQWRPTILEIITDGRIVI